ncbi:hypothetical protein JCM15908A_16620 [Prevotella dentasini JCM 15908]
MLLAATALLPVRAQQVLVCDGATRFPLRDVQTFIDNRLIGKTTYQGLIAIPDSFSTATFQRKGFLSEKLTREEVLRDTVFLYPAEHYLDEVIVYGRHIINGKKTLEKMPKRDILEEQPPHSMGEFDLGILLDKRFRRDKEHVEKLREIFRKMDGDDDDPIMKAYRESQKDTINTRKKPVETQ